MLIGFQEWTRREMEDRVAEIQARHTHFESIANTDKSGFRWLKMLFAQHPDADELELATIVDIWIAPNYLLTQYNEFRVKLESGREFAVSWRKCGRSSQPDEKLTRAMRGAIVDQILDFKRGSGWAPCKICGCTTGKFHIDHVIHFKQLMEQWREIARTRGLVHADLIEDENCCPCFPAECEFGRGWQQYHREHAQLQTLCAPCNLKRPKWVDPAAKRQPRRPPRFVAPHYKLNLAI